MRPRFSVVIPVRNRADVVGRAVAGVLAQTFGQLEVVVVDDGSTDDSVAVARSVSDRRVQIVRQAPAGEAAARSSGVQRAHGRYVTVLDPDDEVAPGWLARLGQLIDATGASLATCGGEQRHLDGSRTVIAPTCFRPGAFVVERPLLIELGSFGGPLEPATLAQVHDALQRQIDERDLVVVSTPEVLVQWNDPVEPVRESGATAQLHGALQAIDALARTPIPDGALLARYATIGGIAAVQVDEHREARRLFRLALSVRPDVVKHWARWAVAHISPLAVRVWDEQGERRDDSDPADEAGAGVEPTPGLDVAAG